MEALKPFLLYVKRSKFRWNISQRTNLNSKVGCALSFATVF